MFNKVNLLLVFIGKITTKHARISKESMISIKYSRATCTKTAAHTWHADAIRKLLLFWPTVARRRRLESDLDERSFTITKKNRITWHFETQHLFSRTHSFTQQFLF